MGVDKVEAATTEGTPELEARLGVGLLALTAVKGEHLDVYASARTSSTKSRTKQPAEGSASVGYMLVRQSTFTRHSPAFGVSRDARRRMRVRGGLSAPAVALSRVWRARIRATSQEAQRGSPRGTPLPHQP
jgi:hypothetical protein